jgi:NitT/TauT family transport system ATP-binding protein
MSARLTVRNLSVAFRLPNDQVVTALAGVSCAIAAGEFVCLVGPSGSGKSTLLRVLAGLQAPERGQALIDDELITQPSARVAVMFQDANLMPWRTVIDNIALPLELGGMGREQRYGEALWRVLVQRPDILLLDEPFGALDAMTRERVSLDLMALWDGTRPTVLMVTHDIHEAVMLSDRVLVMSRRPGRILADIAVGLPRPRAVADTYHAQFGALAAQVRAAIEDA